MGYFATRLVLYTSKVMKRPLKKKDVAKSVNMTPRQLS